MKKLSTGANSTLGEYRKLCVMFFGVRSHATKYFDRLIKESPNGENEEVITEESQMLYLVGQLAAQDYNNA